MGCSSSSTQTVDQEKRPGTKPEETNGDTLMAQNGIISEDAGAIKVQEQLPVQGSLPGESSPGPAVHKAEEEVVLVASEALEDQGSLEELSEQQASAVSEESTPSVTVEPVEVKPASPEVEESPVEPFQAEEPQEDEALEAPAEVPAVDTVVQLVEESPDVIEAAQPTEASAVAEEVEKVDDDTQMGDLAPADPPCTPDAQEDQTQVLVAASPSAAEEDLLIDAQIAEATIPEVISVSPDLDQPQDQAQSPPEEVEEEAPAATADTDKADVEPPSEDAQEEELPATLVPAISIDIAPETEAASPETPVMELNDSEDPSAPTVGEDSTPEPSSEVSSTQASAEQKDG